jgi:hypothetical protein
LQFQPKRYYRGKMDKDSKDLKRLVRDAGYRNLTHCCQHLPITYGTLRNWMKSRSTPAVDIFTLDEILDLLNTDFNTFVNAIKVSRKNLKSKKSKPKTV